MSHTTLTTTYDAGQTGKDTTHTRQSHDALIADIEQVLTGARPRLLRLAGRQGVAPDDADDVVQETLVEAWKHLERLRAPS